MPVSTTTAGVAASLMPFLDYFRPTKSPYLLVVLVGVAGIVAIDIAFQYQFDERSYWYFASIPLTLVLIVLTLFTFLHQMEPNADETERDIESQLKFSRSICISGAMLCLVAGVVKFAEDENNVLFSVHFLSCVWQIGVFVVYAAARLRKEEPASSLNHFQISLVTASYLIAATICVYFMETDGSIVTIARESDTSEEDVTYMDLFFVSAIVFWLLWISCQVYWTSRLCKIINISVKVRSHS